MKKLALSTALAGVLVSGAVAENEGFFVGASLANRQVKAEVETQGVSAGSGTDTGMKLGIVGGYNQAISGDLGLRYYAMADFLDDTTNVNANVDVLYSFVKNDTLEFRGFAGLFAGFASHDTYGDGSESISGFDAGLNIGVRGVFAEKHGVELFGKFGFLTQDKDYEYYSFWYGTTKQTLKISQPYQIGLRYTFSF